MTRRVVFVARYSDGLFARVVPLSEAKTRYESAERYGIARGVFDLATARAIKLMIEVGGAPSYEGAPLAHDVEVGIASAL